MGSDEAGIDSSTHLWNCIVVLTDAGLSESFEVHVGMH